MPAKFGANEFEEVRFMSTCSAQFRLLPQAGIERAVGAETSDDNGGNVLNAIQVQVEVLVQDKIQKKRIPAGFDFGLGHGLRLRLDL
jgi:hypothetical protein